MKRLLIALCAALLAVAFGARSATVLISPTFLGCTQPGKVTIAPSGGVWFPCAGVLAELLYAPGV